MKYIVYDLEATCWENEEKEKSEMEIIEIGAVKLSKDYEILEKFKVVIKPEKNPILSDFCKSLTGISQEEVDNGITLREAIERFKEFIGEDEFRLGSWGAFDKFIIIRECSEKDIEHSFINHHFNLKYAFARKVYKKPMGLEKALKFSKLRFEGNLHRALDDSINTANIVRVHRLFDQKKQKDA